MFNKENKLEKFKDAETIIGASIKVKGNFHGQGNIVIEGTLEGSLKTDANIFIGEKARVTANIEAKDLIVNGEIKGSIKVKSYLSLGGTAKINGDVQYGELSIERGAIINGQLIAINDTNKKGEVREAEKNQETEE
ncbi:MAG: polymer-forming cytoskeletal protein [Patescibacteria group bacterium]